MLRPSPLPHARAVAAGLVLPLLAAVVLGAMTPLSGPAAASALAAAAAPGTDQPLVPHIGSITPDYVPAKGPIVVQGTLTNASDNTWTSINVHAFMGTTPITTASALASAVHTPFTADVGPRITVTGTFDSIPSLAPGKTVRFKLTLPRKDLPVTSAGVYWFGVHVLGDNGQGDSRVAVGRDRTFLAFVPSAIAAGPPEDIALVVPVRAGVARGPDGAVIDPGAWTSSLRHGPLHSALSIGRAAQGRPLTWLVDPAVPDVVRRLAHGNPARSLSSGKASGSDGSPKPSPSTSSSASEGAAATSTTPPTGAASRKAARQWLHQLKAMLTTPSSQVLGLPFGDLALETAASYDLPLLREAYRHTRHALSPWGVSLSPVAAPPDGLTTADTISRLPLDAEVVLPDTAVTGATSVVDQVAGHRVVLTASGAAQGGPGPVAPQSSLALRQRLLAEAAVRLLDRRQPLVVQLPVDAHHPLTPGFFAGLGVPWAQLTTVAGATSGAATPLSDDRLRTPPDDAPALGPRLYFLARQALAGASLLQSVVTGNHSLVERVLAEVTGNASYAAAQQKYLALYRMRSASHWVARQLHAITVAAPPSVTLASSSGRFSALVSNDLDVPVVVKLRAVGDPSMKISGTQLVQLAAHGRASILLNASTNQRGVHNVTLELTTPDGRLIGSSDEFPMRAEQVSGLIWVIIGTGVGLLFAAIVVRLVRRVLRERARRRGDTGMSRAAGEDTRPATGPVTSPATGPATEPATERATERATEPTTHPAEPVDLRTLRQVEP